MARQLEIFSFAFRALQIVKGLLMAFELQPGRNRFIIEINGQAISELTTFTLTSLSLLELLSFAWRWRDGFLGGVVMFTLFVLTMPRIDFQKVVAQH